MAHKSESGFTLIEVVTTLFVVSLFLAFFFQLTITAQKQRSAVEKRSIAADIAYSNLKKFPQRPSTLTCTAGDDMDQSTAGSESKPGRLIGSSVPAENPATFNFSPEPSNVVSRLGTYSKQTVRAFAPQGCASPDAPIRIESVVLYGDTEATAERIVHAAFITN